MDTRWMVEKFIMDDKQMIIINTHDEKPHVLRACNNLREMIVQYQHGGVKYKGSGISGALVFRMVDTIYPYNVHTNRLLNNCEEKIAFVTNRDGSVSDIKLKRKRMYEEHDDIAYCIDNIEKLEQSI